MTGSAVLQQTIDRARAPWVRVAAPEPETPPSTAAMLAGRIRMMEPKLTKRELLAEARELYKQMECMWEDES